MGIDPDRELKTAAALAKTLWKGSCESEIIRASEKAFDISRTAADELSRGERIALLRAYLVLAEKARDTAFDRRELLLRAGTDRYCVPVGNMNRAYIKASQAVKTLGKRISAEESEEKKYGLRSTHNTRGILGL